MCYNNNEIINRREEREATSRDHLLFLWSCICLCRGSGVVLPLLLCNNLRKIYF
uniref:Uncharacterized protein n=1 Tax=Podoviridae sp. ctjev1 TaxID=2825272 RepID=A0A8S5TUF7_9CAUD|nr:MAG TPA: hypothetical protein [Podoviridae sp. ctjev1]